jgi:hypothetical protein
MFICIILGIDFCSRKILTYALRIFHEFSDLFEFGGSRDGFRVRIKERRASVAHALSSFSLNAIFLRIIISILVFCNGQLEDKLC